MIEANNSGSENPTEEWITTKEAAKMLGVSPSPRLRVTLIGLVRNRKLPGTARTKFSRSDLEKMVKESVYDPRAEREKAMGKW